MYTTGMWMTKKGKGEEFARRWQENVDRMALEHPGVTFRLLRDTDDARNFVSIAGPWRGAEDWERVRHTPAFQETLAAVQETLESSEIRSYELVAEIS